MFLFQLRIAKIALPFSNLEVCKGKRILQISAMHAHTHKYIKKQTNKQKLCRPLTRKYMRKFLME